MHDVVSILDRNWQWRRDAEEVERREQMRLEARREEQRRVKQRGRYRWLGRCAYVSAGMTMNTTLAALLMGMSGWLAVTGAAVTAGLFAVGQAFEAMGEGRR